MTASRPRTPIGGTGNPGHGARFELTLAPSTASVVYRGHARFPGYSVPLEIEVTAAAASTRCSPPEPEGVDGAAPHLDAGELDAVAKTASALVRATTKSPMTEGRPPPRKIVRWRPVGPSSEKPES